MYLLCCSPYGIKHSAASPKINNKAVPIPAVWIYAPAFWGHTKIKQESNNHMEIILVLCYIHTHLFMYITKSCPNHSPCQHIGI